MANPKKKKKMPHRIPGASRWWRRRAVQEYWNYTYVRTTNCSCNIVCRARHAASVPSALLCKATLWLDQSFFGLPIPSPISWVLHNTSTNQLGIVQYLNQSAAYWTIPPPISWFLYDTSTNQLFTVRYLHQSATYRTIPPPISCLQRHPHQSAAYCTIYPPITCVLRDTSTNYSSSSFVYKARGEGTRRI